MSRTAHLGPIASPDATFTVNDVHTSPTVTPDTGRWFRGDVEGLRAVAVLLVLAYHARFGFTGGYVGVDVFFTVSGFLVTKLLVDQHAATGTINLPVYWARRIRRLFPASALVVVATAVAGFALLEPGRRAALAGDAISAITGTANVRFAAAGDYLTGVALPSPLRHYWSLAVEEQFYLLWPIVLAVTLRRSRRVTIAATVLLTGASLAVSATMTAAQPAVAYFWLPFRSWELLAGALLALSGRHLVTNRVAATGLAAAGLAAIGVSSWTFGADTVFPGSAAIVPVAGTLAVLAGAASPIGRLLSVRPLQWVGSRSYALYLWHWPILILAEAHWGFLDVPTRVACLAVTVLAAAVTYRLVEAPTRTWATFGRPRVAYTAAMLTAVAVTVAVSVTVHAIPNGPPPGPAAVAASAAAPADPAAGAAAIVGAADTHTTAATTTGDATYPVGGAAPAVDPGRVLLVGDSTLAPLRWFEDATRSLAGFDYVLDGESCRRLAARSCVGREDRRPDPVAATIDTYTDAGDRFDTIVVMGGYHTEPDRFTGELGAVIDAARRHGARQLVWVTLRESLAFPAPGSDGSRSIYALLNDAAADTLAAAADDPAGGPMQLYAADWNRWARNDWFRSDGIHVNFAGALALGEYLSATLTHLGVCADGSCLPAADTPDAILARWNMVDTDRHCYELGADRTRSCMTDTHR